MPSNYSVPTPLEYFAALVQVGQGDAIALLEAAACIAHDTYPDLDVQQFLDEMDRLQERLGRPVATGVFGADMRVSLVNDGPFTVMLDSEELGFSPAIG